MVTGRKNVIGLRKIVSRSYPIVKSVDYDKKKKTGKIVINSRRLRDNIGETARVVVYLKRKR